MNSSELSVQKVCWVCDYCNQMYASKYNRDLHIKQIHIATKCEICSVVFSSISLWRKHYNKEHSNGVQSTARNEGIGQKLNEKQDKSRKSTKMPASSKKKRKSDTHIKGESFEGI